jgi:hypothetical protein
MKVKVGGMIYDSEVEPVMVILTNEEKNRIANMDQSTTKYCAYPDQDQWIKDDYKAIKEWMKI